MVDNQLSLDYGHRPRHTTSEEELVRRAERERRRHELRGGIGATIDLVYEEENYHSSL